MNRKQKYIKKKSKQKILAFFPSLIFSFAQVTFENLFEFLLFFILRLWVCLSKHLWQLVTGSGQYQTSPDAEKIIFSSQAI